MLEVAQTGREPRGASNESLRKRRTVRFPAQLVLVFIISFSVFLLLRTHDYTTVDGALRALGVYHAGKPFLHQNNHLLYPVNVYAWSTVLNMLRIRANDAVGFLALAQAMNAFAAAGFLVVLYGACYKLTGSAGIAGTVTAGFGLSRAFLVHAVNSAEPMVGLFWSAVATALAAYAVTRGKRWAGIAAGAVLALAMATYQSMVLLGVPILFLLWQVPDQPLLGFKLRARVCSIMAFATGFALGLICIFGSAYYLSGTRTIAGMIGRFLEVDSGNVYGGAAPLKLVAIPPGLAYALVPCLPADCSGFRCLALEQYRSWIPIAGLSVGIAVLWIFAMLIITKKVRNLIGRQERTALIFCALGLAFSLAPIVYWMPTYDKLWLQPLALLFLSCGILVNAASRSGVLVMRTRGLPRLGLALVIVSGVWNLARAERSNARATPFFAEARRIAAVVTPRDLLIGDWNEVFNLYEKFWAVRANTFNVPTEAERNGLHTMDLLETRIKRTQQQGGGVFFLGLLDMPVSEWQYQLAQKRRLPYAGFDAYRGCAKKIASFPYKHSVITLRRLTGCEAGGAQQPGSFGTPNYHW